MHPPLSRACRTVYCAAVKASGFIAMDMTIRNTAGPNGHQAVAMRIGGDQSAFAGLSIEGYQVQQYIHYIMSFTDSYTSSARNLPF
jgi:pectin methylesterase-like acyl-CoA thioesterase